jgi:GNAT superfamily N-acetyltransferase
MNIRHLEPSELPQFFALLQEKAVFDGCPESLQATPETLHEALFSSSPLAYALVVEIDGQLIGMATYYGIFSSFIAKPCLWLDDLYICEAFRGRGIGRELMKRLCEIAQEKGCGRVDWHVSAFNERGIKFYESLGATISERAKLVRLDEAAIEAFINNP